MSFVHAARADEPNPVTMPADAQMEDEALLKARQQIHALEQASGRLESFYDLPQESRDAISRARFKRQLPLENFTDSVSWKNLVALLDFLEDRGAQVCIVRTPIIPEYSQAIDENPEGKRFTAALEALRLQSDHRSGVSFRDFTDVVAELPGFYFKNQDHLNALGRKAYWPTVERACFDEEAIEPLLYH